MVVFEKALTFLLEHEGGYVNHPHDAGGETYAGISRRWYPKWEGFEIVDTTEDKSMLKGDVALREAVAEFYFKYYWMKLRCDLIEDPFIAEMLFITAVHQGKRVAIKKVQRILKVQPDGFIGVQTINALNESASDTFIYHFLLELVDFYMEIGKQGHNKSFRIGWINRVLSMYYRYELLEHS